MGETKPKREYFKQASHVFYVGSDYDIKPAEMIEDVGQGRKGLLDTFFRQRFWWNLQEADQNQSTWLDASANLEDGFCSPHNHVWLAADGTVHMAFIDKGDGDITLPFFEEYKLTVAEFHATLEEIINQRHEEAIVEYAEYQEWIKSYEIKNKLELEKLRPQFVEQAVYAVKHHLETFPTEVTAELERLGFQKITPKKTE